MNKKPELSPAIKARANELFLMLKQRTYTKQELQEHFYGKVTSNNERRIRDLISTLAKRVPIIATSDSKGYYVASTAEDLEKVKHQWKELDSRISELDKRRKPLIDFYETHGGKYAM